MERVKMQVIPKQESKALFRLKKLVGLDCTIRLRSNSETIITGVLDSFDLDITPSFLVLDCDNRGYRIINFHDVSFIEEIRSFR